MFDFVVHPNVYTTGNQNGLRAILEDMWVKNLPSGSGTIYIVSGFSNFNGGARFYKTLKEHTENGGNVVAVLGGSPSQRLSSKQVVEALLECGASVHLINRKRLLHAKCYGYKDDLGNQSAVIGSGNFTGPGLSQNIEASVYLKEPSISQKGFNWDDFITNLLSQNWQYHKCDITPQASCWKLLYDETPRNLAVDESDAETLIVRLVPTDTNRILAIKGTNAAKGSQYFWLSKDCFDFFPPLTIRNKKGWKGTLSTMITMNYVDLNITKQERVTFEAENNLDFRLGTGAYRCTSIASPGDLACITRITDDHYEIRIIDSNHASHPALDQFATIFVGAAGKRYGFIDNSNFNKLI